MPFGEKRTISGTTSITETDFGYTGQRDYSDDFSLMACFTQPDTIVPQPGSSQAWNRYSYTLNNPVKYNDPSGHIPLIDGLCTTTSCRKVNPSSYANTEPGSLNPTPLTPETDPTVAPGAKGDDGIDKELKKKNKIPEYCRDIDWNSPECYNLPENYFNENPYTPECRNLPDFSYPLGNWRGPDYRKFEFGTTIPTPWTGTAIGWHFTLTKDRYDQWYFGLGLDIGQGLLGADASFVGGYPNEIMPPDQLRDYISGNDVDFGFGALLYIGETFGTGSNEEFGVATPQIGGGYTYTWALP